MCPWGAGCGADSCGLSRLSGLFAVMFGVLLVEKLGCLNGWVFV